MLLEYTECECINTISIIELYIAPATINFPIYVLSDVMPRRSGNGDGLNYWYSHLSQYRVNICSIFNDYLRTSHVYVFEVCIYIYIYYSSRKKNPTQYFAREIYIVKSSRNGNFAIVVAQISRREYCVGLTRLRKWQAAIESHSLWWLCSPRWINKQPRDGARIK